MPDKASQALIIIKIDLIFVILVALKIQMNNNQTFLGAPQAQTWAPAMLYQQQHLQISHTAPTRQITAAQPQLNINSLFKPEPLATFTARPDTTTPLISTISQAHTGGLKLPFSGSEQGGIALRSLLLSGSGIASAQAAGCGLSASYALASHTTNDVTANFAG